MPEIDLEVQRRLALGRRVRELRGVAGLTQTELARRSGLQRTFVNSIEAGSRNVTDRVLWALADALGVTPAAFYQGWSAF